MTKKLSLESSISIEDLQNKLKTDFGFKFSKFKTENNRLIIKSYLDEIIIEKNGQLLNITIQCSELEAGQTGLIFIFGYIIASVLFLLNLFLWQSIWIFILLIFSVLIIWIVNKVYNKLKYMDTSDLEIYQSILEKYI